jgi:outer membrane lipoprotein carrier protein
MSIAYICKIQKNKMTKITGFLLLLIVGFSTLTVQAQKGIGSNDPQAKKILDAVSAKLRTYKNVEAKFSVKIENSAGKNLGVKTGTFYLKGSKYRITATGQEVFSDGSNTWTLDKASKECSINKIDPNATTITPQKLFTNFYDKDFLYKLNGTTKGVSEIELTPLDKTKPIFKMLLYITNNAITSAKFLEKTGNRYILSISNVNPNSTASDATFIFDAKKFPGVDVVDLR